MLYKSFFLLHLLALSLKKIVLSLFNISITHSHYVVTYLNLHLALSVFVDFVLHRQ
jgi:hypothetical protein